MGERFSQQQGVAKLVMDPAFEGLHINEVFLPFLPDASECKTHPDGKDGVIDGARTRDNQNHNLGLYQLSYDHRFVGGRENCVMAGVLKRKNTSY